MFVLWSTMVDFSLPFEEGCQITKLEPTWAGPGTLHITFHNLTMTKYLDIVIFELFIWHCRISGWLRSIYSLGIAGEGLCNGFDLGHNTVHFFRLYPGTDFLLELIRMPSKKIFLMKNMFGYARKSFAHLTSPPPPPAYFIFHTRTRAVTARYWSLLDIPMQ